jgi:hypothetical protein
MKTRPTPILLLLLAAGGCGSEPITVSLSGIEAGIARFEIDNPSPNDLRSAAFELVLRAGDGSVARVDTVTYEATAHVTTCDILPVVRAGEQRAFSWRAPRNCTSATATVLEATFFEGTVQPGESSARWCPDG